VDLAGDIGVELDGADRLQPLGQRHEGGRRGPAGWLARRRQGGHPPAVRHHQQGVQLRSLNICKGSSQAHECEPLGSRTRLPGQPLDRRQCRRQDFAFAELVDQSTDQNRPDIGAQRDRQ